ncbi:MAG: class I SAM-dependent methyltransferase [Rhizobiaceae bacterium]|nr:class I SAM-dependent methyltransferase [Rhizobiaceae bacterium]
MSFSFIVEEPPLPTLSRWIELNRRYGGNSTLRMLEYECLSKVELSGKVLDVGGGKNARYVKHLQSGIEYASVNIDKEIEPTYLINPGDKLPLEDNSIDCCSTMNTLEHVYDPKFQLKEINRVLKPGGKVVISIPWIFRIHGHPDDYSRRTPSWWRIALEETGYSQGTLMPLVWGRYSVASSISGIRGIFVGLRNHLVHLRDVLYATVLFRNSGGKYSGRRGERICNVAPGHFIVAHKPTVKKQG